MLSGKSNSLRGSKVIPALEKLLCPKVGYRSTSKTLCPRLARFLDVCPPAGPPPITTTSYKSIIFYC